jgi:A/G-specific adenine glycosylase
LNLGTLPTAPHSTAEISSFRRNLLRWYGRHGRDLPWRRTRDPYAVLVSEIMLQQTQVATVIPYYNEWLRRFPDFRVLAHASESEVLHAWQGLGYYSRARNLHAAAARISRDHKGQCPATVIELAALPGIGRYTSNAILTFAFDRPVPIVEANIVRLLARMFSISASIDTTPGREAIWNHAARLVPPRRARDFNSALMDLGATICLPRAPQCGICPAKPFCRATNPLRLPRKKPRPALKKVTERHLLTMQCGRVLLQHCQKRWRGMWMLPEWNGRAKKSPPLHISTFPFTHHQVTLEIFSGSAREISSGGKEKWFSVAALDSIPVPSPHRRALVALLKKKVAALRPLPH